MTTHIGVLYDKFTENVKSQIVRDLMTLKAKWPDIAVRDFKAHLEPALCDLMGVDISAHPKPSFYLVYKVGPRWPVTPSNASCVKRDLELKHTEMPLSGEERVSYHLREQGRVGNAMTELYLNRTAPRSNGGTADTMTLMRFG